MEDLERLADQAEDEVQGLKERCDEAGHDSASRCELWSGIRRWIAHPKFGKGSRVTSLQTVVLNELEFTLFQPELKDER